MEARKRHNAGQGEQIEVAQRTLAHRRKIAHVIETGGRLDVA
jgi:hypothetical protein